MLAWVIGRPQQAIGLHKDGMGDEGLHGTYQLYHVPLWFA